MMSPIEQKAVMGILVHAALADGSKSDAERNALRSMSGAMAGEAINPWVVYQEVLSGKVTVETAAAELQSNEARLLAYEMAVGVCDTDGVPNAAEQAFLDRLRTALRISNASAAANDAEQAAKQIAAAIPVASGTAASAAAPVAEGTVERQVPINLAGLEKRILNHAILTGALELLPQSLATMAIVPLQMKLVYAVGKEHGYTLDRGHIRDFMATAGAGLAAQAVEGYARKLLGGVVGSLLGGGMIGGLGRAAVRTGTGAAITFGATYAIGHLAIRYYGGGRKMELAVLKDTYAKLLEKGRNVFAENRGAVEQRAATLTPGEVIQLVKE
ncbi:MAG: TerB family tellurite resistance protein [Opitutaceae bacterium]|nr:TerB family tellurite resistance protein [Opitutaceae bacterium]